MPCDSVPHTPSSLVERLLVVRPHRGAELERGAQLIARRTLADQHGADVADRAGVGFLLAGEVDVPVLGELLRVAHGVLRAQHRDARSTSRAGGVIDVKLELDRIRLDEPARGLRGEVAPRLGDVEVEVELARRLRHALRGAR